MNQVVAQGEINQYQISERKHWEQKYAGPLSLCKVLISFSHYSPHPYIFFNQDKVSITFVGFVVSKQGDLIDPNTQRVIEQAIMSPKLYEGLSVNKVDFADHHSRWTKPLMINKISTVMGVDFPHDPDETYVLTVDNVIKILAIQMRFR